MRQMAGQRRKYLTGSPPLAFSASVRTCGRFLFRLWSISSRMYQSAECAQKKAKVPPRSASMNFDASHV